MTVNLTLNEISVKRAMEVLNIFPQNEVSEKSTESLNTAVPIVASKDSEKEVSAVVPTAAIPQGVSASMPAQTVTVPTASHTPSVSTTVPSYTIEQLQTAIMPLLDAGKVAQVQALVQSFGVTTLMEIPKERYSEFANGLRSLGGAL